MASFPLLRLTVDHPNVSSKISLFDPSFLLKIIIDSHNSREYLKLNATSSKERDERSRSIFLYSIPRHLASQRQLLHF